MQRLRSEFKIALISALGILLVASLLAVGFSTTRASAPAGLAQQSKLESAKISGEVRSAFSKDPNAKLRYLVVLAIQANVQNDISNWNAKGQYVLDTLKSVANSTQPLVRDFLSQQVRAGNVDKFKSYYIINGFSVTGNLASAEAIATLPEVAAIAEFPVITLDDEPVAPRKVDLSELLDINLPASFAQAAPEAIEWNVNIIRAPQAWAMTCNGGPCTGTGIVIGSLDTGARYTHQAIVGKYRGNLGGGNFDHNYNWWPAVGSSLTPVDSAADSYHGSHTIGTATGDDGGTNQIGIAPGAKWISTNGIAAGLTEPDIIEAGQWILAPWDLNGQNADPSKRPHIASNSWGYGGSSFSCPTATFFRTVVQSWVAAGIFPSYSSGNAGTTGNRPPSAYPETFETGNITNSGIISSSSSRGPSCFDGGQHPQVVAGGTNVRSVNGANDTSYQFLSGTSMAQPATAGSAAILLQANPNLTIPQIWYVLTSTAYMSPTWGSAPNVTYGWGLIQLDQAVLAAQAMGGTPTPTATGTPPTSTPTPTRTNTPIVSPTVCVANYIVTASSGATIVPGDTMLAGTSCDDCSVNLPLPFSFSFYGQSFNSVNVVSNGNLQFSSTDTTWTNTCEPAPIHDDVIHVYWDDLLLTTAGDGVYTSVSGSAPNRIMNIEWRGCYYNGGVCGGPVNVEARLYEANGQIDVIYGTAGNGNASATGGVQKDTGSPFLQAYCNGAGLPVSAGTMHTYTQGACGSVTPSPPVPTNTPAATSTPCVGGDGSIVFNGALATGDPTLATRLFRDDPANTCAAPQPYAGTSGTGPFFYDTYTVPGGGSATCVTIILDAMTCIGTPFIHASAYQNSFDPNNLATNYLGDVGASPDGTTNPKTFSVTLPAGANLVVVVNAVTSGAGGACAGYSVTVEGLGGGGCPTPGPTNTSQPGATNTPTTEPTGEPTTGATETATSGPPTATSTLPTNPTDTPEVTATPTSCALEFTDVPPGHTFYTWIRCLACQGIINGYPCGGQGEPCDQDNNPYFRPGNLITRGQLTKIVAISAGYNDPVSGQTFEDVLPGTAFYTYTEQLSGDGVIGGYPCGQLEGEPCIPPDNRPYFRPGNSTTRGQLTKIVALAAGFNDPAPNTFTFTDVPVGHTFHIYVEALLLNRPGVMEGYPCGGPGEPCDSENRNYFRPNNNLTRGQASKIVSNTFFPGCNPPLDANSAESYLLR